MLLPACLPSCPCHLCSCALPACLPAYQCHWALALFTLRLPACLPACLPIVCPAQQVWEDETNADNRHARNHIRNVLLPYMGKHFNSRVEQALGRTAEVRSVGLGLGVEVHRWDEV